MAADDPAALELDTPLLLTLGSDSRSELVDAQGTLSRYGCCPEPRRAVPFGSCTASSPLPQVYAAAVSAHQALCRAAARSTLEQEIRRQYAVIVQQLHHTLSIGESGGVRFALTPSGTDAEFLALLLALGRLDRPLCNIIVGPREVGSGSEPAAGGLHFDSVVPFGEGLELGAPVSERVARLVHVRTIQLRDVSGTVREPRDLDAETTQMVAAAVGRGERVLLHVVSHSKTGVHAPSLPTVRALQQRYTELVVVVDAAQGRISRQGLLAALRQGFLVLLTGSKFYGGPPFSGTLIVPPAFDPVALELPPMPEEFGSYFSLADFPPSWGSFTSRLGHRYNLGLLLRWTAAIAAFHAYYEVPGQHRFAVLRRYEDGVPPRLRASRWLDLDLVEPVHFPAGEERLLESKTTVFPFRVRKSAAPAPAVYFESHDLKRIAAWVNADLSSLGPTAVAASDSDDPSRLRECLATRYHVGQPVFKGSVRHPAVLRLALGAALVSEVGANEAYGSTIEERLAWLDRQVEGVVTKLEFVAGHFDELAAFESGS